MTRAESLAFVVSVMPHGYARDVIRATLKGWPEEDVAAWHRLKDNERKQAKRDERKEANVRSRAGRQTGQVLVSTEVEDRTSSGLVRGEQPDAEHVSPPSPPQVSPTPPSSPAPAPVHTQAREAKPKPPNPESVPLPDSLATLSAFQPMWLKFIEHRVLIKKPLTYLAAERVLTRLAQRPNDAIKAVDFVIERQWQSFSWQWYDEQHETQQATRRVNGHNGHEHVRFDAVGRAIRD